MRFAVTNNSKAPRGVHSVSGGLVFIQPGETRTIDVANFERELRAPCLESVCTEDVSAPPPELAKLIAPFDGDGDGKPGGSKAPAGDLKALRAAYKEKMGKRPFSGWDAAELMRRMGDA